jgi:hypothetical protein
MGKKEKVRIQIAEKYFKVEQKCMSSTQRVAKRLFLPLAEIDMLERGSESIYIRSKFGVMARKMLLESHHWYIPSFLHVAREFSQDVKIIVKFIREEI